MTKFYEIKHPGLTERQFFKGDSYQDVCMQYVKHLTSCWDYDVIEITIFEVLKGYNEKTDRYSDDCVHGEYVIFQITHVRNYKVKQKYSSISEPIKPFKFQLRLKD